MSATWLCSVVDVTGETRPADSPMTSIQQPWPPADYQEPLPFDQRGACWPWGPCGVVDKLQIRYDAIAISLAGPLDDAWDVWKTGQMFVPDIPNCSKKSLALIGKPRPGTASKDQIFIELSNDGITWRCRFQSLVSIGPDIGFLGNIAIGTDICETSLMIQPLGAEGPAPVPDFVQLTRRLWYDPVPYPYYGP